MTDTQLLERAAQAQGWKYFLPFQIDTVTDKAGWVDEATGDVYWEDLWNPLRDDADAFRLMMALRISLEQDASVEITSFTHRGVTTGEYALGVEAWVVDKLGRVIKAQEVYGTDFMEATRRCIVRVAAQLAEKYEVDPRT